MSFFNIFFILEFHQLDTYETEENNVIYFFSKL